MWKKDRILNWMLILLAAVLIIVLIFGIFNSGIRHLTSRRNVQVEEVENTASAEEQNAIDISAAEEEPDEEEAEEEAAEEEPDEENENAIAGTGSAHEAIQFSDAVEDKIGEMTVEQQVAQLFVTTPEALTGTDDVTLAGEATQSAIETYPVGGLIYAARNLTGDTQMRNLLQYTQEYMEGAVGLQTFAIIEESGGETHSPVANILGNTTATASPSELGGQSTTDEISQAAQTRASYINSYGFNAVLGPVADESNGYDTDYDEITYGADALDIADCVEADIEGTQAAGVMAIMRAFPGANKITDNYLAYQAGIDAGIACIMVSNMPDFALTGDESLPCSLSGDVVTQLRENMGYDGLLMTSNLSSQRITDYCSTAEAAISAISAGMDLIYVENGFAETYQAVLDAVNDGTIATNTLHNAVGRVLTEKME